MIETLQRLHGMTTSDERRRKFLARLARHVVAEDRAGCPHQEGRQIAGLARQPVPALVPPAAAPEVVVVRHDSDIFLAAI